MMEQRLELSVSVHECDSTKGLRHGFQHKLTDALSDSARIQALQRWGAGGIALNSQWRFFSLFFFFFEWALKHDSESCLFTVTSSR